MVDRIPELKMTSEHNEAQKFGAVVFILDDSGRIYTQAEKELDKQTGKRPGQYSVVCEKREPGENDTDNIFRGLSEELGISIGNLDEVLDFSRQKIWETQFIDKVWATVMVIRCKNSNLLENLVEEGDTDGVESIGFLPREEFESLFLREGVRNIINKFGNSIFDFEK